MGLGVAWLDVPLGVACLLAGLHHLGLALGRRAPALPAAGYAVMGFGMAAVFGPAADPVPRAAWVAVFAASALWFGIGRFGIGRFGTGRFGTGRFGTGLLRRVGPRSRDRIHGGPLFGDAGHHVVGALAMLFMLLVPGHGMASGLLASAVALLLAAWFLADIVALVAHPAPVAVPAPATAAAMGTPAGAVERPGPDTARGLPVACLVMDGAMALMLVVMA